MNAQRFPVFAAASWSLACAGKRLAATAIVLSCSVGLIAMQALLIGILERDHALPRPAMAVLFVVSSLLVTIATVPAWLRVLVQQPLPSGVPFRLGRQEFQVFWANVLVGLAMFLAVIPVFLATMLTSYRAGAGAGSGGSLGLLAAWIPLIFIAVTVVLFLLVAVRFGAAPAITLLRGSVVFEEAWSASKRDWPGVALAVIAAAVPVLIVAAPIVLYTGLDLGGSAQAIALDEDNAHWIVNTVAKSVFDVVATFTMAGPFAYLALRHEAGRSSEADLSESPEVDQVDV